MTNEALAELIQQGGNDELFPILWEKTNRLLYKLANEISYKYSERLKQCGYDPDDLAQEAYNVLVAAVKAYKPEKGFKLSTYFGFQFKQVLRRITRNADVLNYSDTRSIDEPISDTDEELKLSDTISDPDSTNGYDKAEMCDYYKPLYQAIDSLEAPDRLVIMLRFFAYPDRLMSYNEIGERLGGISKSAVCSKLQNAYWKLRRSGVGRIYGEDFHYHSYSTGLGAFLRTGTSSVELLALSRLRYEEEMNITGGIDTL